MSSNYYNNRSHISNRVNNNITPDPSMNNPYLCNRSNSKQNRPVSQQKNNQHLHHVMNISNIYQQNANNSIHGYNTSQKVIVDKARAITGNNYNNNYNNFNTPNDFNNNKNVRIINNRPQFVSSEEYMEITKKEEMEKKEMQKGKISENIERKTNNNNFQRSSINNSINPSSNGNKNNLKSANLAPNSSLINNITNRNPNDTYDFRTLRSNNDADKTNLNKNNFHHMKFSDHSVFPQGFSNQSKNSVPVNINKEYSRNPTLNEQHYINNNLDRQGRKDTNSNDFYNKNYANINGHIEEQRANDSRHRRSSIPIKQQPTPIERSGSSLYVKTGSRNSSAYNKDIRHNNTDFYKQGNANNTLNDDIEIIRSSMRNSKTIHSSKYQAGDNIDNDIHLKNQNINNNKNNNNNYYGFTGDSSNYNRDAYLDIANNQNDNRAYDSNFNKHRDDITDINNEIDPNTKNKALEFFKEEKDEKDKYKNNNIIQKQDFDNSFEKKIEQLGGNTTTSFYINDSPRDPNGFDHVNNTSYLQSYNLENNNSRRGSDFIRTLNKNSSLASSKYFSNNDNKNINDNSDKNNFDINRIYECKNNQNQNRVNINSNSIYATNESNPSKNTKHDRNQHKKIDSECLKNIEEILNKNSSSNSEIKNEKIFSSSSISKSYSSNLDDFVHLKETQINRDSLSSFFEVLANKYEAQFEFFYMDLKKCGFSNKEKHLNKIGPISSLDLYIQFKFSDFLKANEPIMAIDLLENNIFRWRNICGDGNCFYRAVMFSYLENILIHNRDFEFLNFIKEIFDFVKKEEIQRIFKKNNIDYDFLIRALFFILYVKASDKFKYPYTKYEILIILINNCRDIDLGLVLFLRIKIFEFIEKNKNKIYSQEFNVKMGNLLNEKYQTDDDNFQWELFYEENLLKLYTEAENIIIYVTPLILQINLKIFTYDIGVEHSDKVRFIGCGLPDERQRHTAFVFYRKIHYDLIYSKEHFERIQNNFSNYFDTTLTCVSVETLKSQAQQALRKLKEKELTEANTNNSIAGSVNKNKNEVSKKEMHIDDSYNINNIDDNKNNNKNKCKNENNPMIENPNLIDFSGSYNYNNSDINNINNSKLINNHTVNDREYYLLNPSIQSIGFKGKEASIENQEIFYNQKLKNNNEENPNPKMDIDDFNYNLLSSIEIEENVDHDKNQVLNREINKSLRQKNTSGIIDARLGSNQKVAPIKNDENLLPLESNLKNIQTAFTNGSLIAPLDPGMSIYGDLVPKKSENSKNIRIENSSVATNNQNNIKNNHEKEIAKSNPNKSINNSMIERHNLTANKSYEKAAEKLEEQIMTCSVCEEELDEKISNFMEQTICANCFYKELKSVLLVKIRPKIEKLLEALLQEENYFLPFDNIFKLDENEPLTIYKNISEVKDYKQFLNIDFKKLIRDILNENCLVCFSGDPRTCVPKNFVRLPCDCSFNSLKHFQIFIKNLIKVNIEDKKLKKFTCLCNTNYIVSDVLKIFETINQYKLDEEFYALKNYLMEYYFKRFCCLCSNILPVKEGGKYPYSFKDNNMIWIFMHVTSFKHFACENCEVIIKNRKKNQKELNKPLVFSCNICNFQHLFEK